MPSRKTPLEPRRARLVRSFWERGISAQVASRALREPVRAVKRWYAEMAAEVPQMGDAVSRTASCVACGGPTEPGQPCSLCAPVALVVAAEAAILAKK